MKRPRYIPPSTYRLQVNGAFTLDDAAGIVAYLRDMDAGAA
jgi:maltooligosyltrehalose synthase